LCADASAARCTTLLFVALMYIVPAPCVGQTTPRPNAATASTSPDGSCEPPQIAMTPFDGGLVRVDISSPCQKRALVSVKDGDVAYIGELNEQGRWQLMLDAFQGNSELIFGFGGKLEIRRRLEHPQLEMLSKVAIVWLVASIQNFQCLQAPMPHDLLQLSPVDVILHVLTNRRVERAFSHQSLPSKSWPAFRRCGSRSRPRRSRATPRGSH
jgi:hypothetical protein